MNIPKWVRISVIAVCLMVNGFYLFGANTDSVRFSYPLKLPMNLSGNYGELRTNHFHAGIDFRVGGVPGAPVYATERGYISRISVSGGGYGNAVYITHPNGYVSVYGHLQRFADKIAKYVITEQYKNKSFSVNLILTPEMFPVQKGEFIANAGNTGSSGGPHLHFEIRNENNVPLNIFERGYIHYPDNTKPEIREIKFFRTSKDSSFIRQEVNVNVGKDGITLLPATFYIGIDAIDRIDGSNARFAVNSYEVFFDKTQIFKFTVGEVPFEYGRYINSLIDYSQKISKKKVMVKTLCDPGNILKDRIVRTNDGIIELNDTLVHSLKVVVKDFFGNSSSKQFKIKQSNSIIYADTVNVYEKINENNLAYWYMPYICSFNNLDVFVPSGALYSNAVIALDTLKNRVSEFSPHFSVGDSGTPLQIPYTVKIKCDIPQNLQSKALIGYTSMCSDEMSGVNATYKDSCLYSILYAFGNFSVVVDTIPPVITTKLVNNAQIKGSIITVKIKDNLSGIQDFKAEIDNEWVLAKWDVKTSTLTIDMKDCKIKRGIHTLKITVSDKKSNTAILVRDFKY